MRKYKTRPRERFLNGEEYGRLGRAVDELEAAGTVSRHAAAAIRLLVLSGCRRNEVLELRWDDIDRTAGELRLRGGKTGARPVPLMPEMRGVLDGIPRVADNPWVIAGQKPGARMTDINTPWLTVRAHAGLEPSGRQEPSIAPGGTTRPGRRASRTNDHVATTVHGKMVLDSKCPITEALQTCAVIFVNLLNGSILTRLGLYKFR